jgi:hypothetical protein
MATLTNSIKKAEKLTGSKMRIAGGFYCFDYKGYDLSFARNGNEDEATNFYTIKDGSRNDYQSDYFPGTFHDNVTQAVKFIERMAV